VIEKFEEMKTETSCQMCFESFLLIPSGGGLIWEHHFFKWRNEKFSVTLLYCSMSGIM